MKTAQDVVNDSGYPLQIRLEQLIEETRENHKWKVLVREHRWVNAETKDEGYIDLILEQSSWNLKLVVECKRIVGSWTFLLPMVEPFKIPEVMALSGDCGTFGNTWSKFRIFPESHEAAFCVMETGGKKDSRTLEKLAGELLLSLEYLAIEEAELAKSFHGGPIPPSDADRIIYLPIIVTTAVLQTSSFSPLKVDIKNGKVTESAVAPIEFIRFRKNLATNISYKKPMMRTLRELNRENDRTVFVVRAESFIEFLSMIRDY
jgi:hypothetical protein